MESEQITLDFRLHVTNNRRRVLFGRLFRTCWAVVIESAAEASLVHGRTELQLNFRAKCVKINRGAISLSEFGVMPDTVEKSDGGGKLSINVPQPINELMDVAIAD